MTPKTGTRRAPEESGPPGPTARRPSGALRQVLVCDHRGGDLLEQVGERLRTSFEVETTRNLRQTLLRLGVAATPRPDVLVLLSASRGGRVELAALENARHAPGQPPVPVLILSGPDDPEAVLRADQILVSGAWDLVPESTGAEEVALRVRRLLDASQREREMDELRHRASHDDRTDLLRPKTFQARLDEHFSAAKRHKVELALVLIDLDRFGQINKQHDHTVGDELIARVGEVIRKALRVEDAAGHMDDPARVNGDDAAGRLGGDEFAVILPFTEKIHAAGVVKRLLAAIRELSGTPPGAKGPIDVSASIGFETFDGNDLDSLQTLRNHAERALRVAKERGGDQGVYYRSLGE